MSPRPLYRWKSFWFGLLTLVFIVCASVDSQYYLSDYSVSAGSSVFELGRVDHATFLTRRPSHPYDIGLPPARLPIDDPEGLLQHVAESDGWAGVSCWWIHDAAIFFPFLLAWAGWLRWRLRRNKRLQAS